MNSLRQDFADFAEFLKANPRLELLYRVDPEADRQTEKERNDDSPFTTQDEAAIHD
jgi:hypothetical protein